MAIKKIKSFNIDCTGDVAVGDEILFTEAVFGGSHRSPVKIGDRRIAALVERDSYGAGKQQHTFTLLVLAADGTDAPKKGSKIRRKGRNVYRNGTLRRPRDEAERNAALADKHERGDAARAARFARKEALAW